MSSVVRFLLLGLVYASELLRGRQMENYYMLARDKLLDYEPVIVNQFPVPKSILIRVCIHH